MSETTQVNKPRNKRKRVKGEHIFLYPEHGLKREMSKSELEVLDSIYSDDTPVGGDQEFIEQRKHNKFWIMDEEVKSPRKIRNSLLTLKCKWFTTGVVVASVLWFSYHQIHIHSLKANEDTKIVFQTAATIITDKSFDGHVASNLSDESIKLASISGGNKQGIPILSGLFTQNKAVESQTNEEITETDGTASSEEQIIEEKEETFHVIKNGDSLWLIAKEYYGEPTPENIRKIMEANRMNQIGYLYPGKKITIPL